MVRLRTEVEVRSIAFDGIRSATPAPGVLEAVRDSEAVILAPSNPFVSVEPILAVPGARDALRTTKAVRAANQPDYRRTGGQGAGREECSRASDTKSQRSLWRRLPASIDVMVIDSQDAVLAPEVEALGMACVVTDTMMTSMERKAELAADVIAACRAFSARR